MLTDTSTGLPNQVSNRLWQVRVLLRMLLLMSASLLSLVNLKIPLAFKRGKNSYGMGSMLQATELDVFEGNL